MTSAAEGVMRALRRRRNNNMEIANFIHHFRSVHGAPSSFCVLTSETCGELWVLSGAWKLDKPPKRKRGPRRRRRISESSIAWEPPTLAQFERGESP